MYTVNTSAAILVKFVRILAKPIRRRVLAATPADPGSLGDEAVIQGLQEGMKGRGLVLRQLVLWPDSDFPCKYSQIRPFFITPWSRVHLVRFLFSLVFVDHFLVLGTDVFDGNYAASRPMFWLTLCNWALAAGVPTRIVSFSFSEEPNAEVLTAIRNSDRRLEFFCRDEVSLRRFVRHTGLPATLTADLAFLLLPETSSTAYQRCRDQVTDSRSRGNALIGVNFNSLTFSADYSTSVNSCKTSLDAILRRVPSAFVLLIPHDSRFNNMDLAVARDVYRLTDDSLKQRIVLIDSRLHAWDVKAIVGLLDVVVTGRMHLAIAALGQGVPSICMAYMGKFEGLLRRFELDHLVVQPNGADASGNLARKVEEVLRHKQEITAAIKSALPDALRAAEGNLQNVGKQ